MTVFLNDVFSEELARTMAVTSKRPYTQLHARAITEATPNPFNQPPVKGGFMYPEPGKGVSGESSN